MELILAITPEGGIGKNNGLPWMRIDGDLPRFKNLTMGKTVVMGRNTWNSLPGKLKGRKNVIITRTPDDSSDPDVIFTSDITPYVSDPSAILIGGAELIATNWHNIDTIYLTITRDSYDFDTCIDFSKLIQFEAIRSTPFPDHTFQILKRKQT